MPGLLKKRENLKNITIYQIRGNHDCHLQQRNFIKFELKRAYLVDDILLLHKRN
jgi:hypothetical protein